MAPISLSDIISALPSEDSWGPVTSTETILNGVPYAPYSKGDKLGRMADWTTEGKDGRDGRGGRQQYNRNYRGMISAFNLYMPYISTSSLHTMGWEKKYVLTFRFEQINKFTVLDHPHFSRFNSLKMNPPFLL
jgi:hypothetical protein